MIRLLDSEGRALRDIVSQIHGEEQRWALFYEDASTNPPTMRIQVASIEESLGDFQTQIIPLINLKTKVINLVAIGKVSPDSNEITIVNDVLPLPDQIRFIRTIQAENALGAIANNAGIPFRRSTPGNYKTN